MSYKLRLTPQATDACRRSAVGVGRGTPLSFTLSELGKHFR